jgi:hypothetical protein
MVRFAGTLHASTGRIKHPTLRLLLPDEVQPVETPPEGAHLSGNRLISAAIESALAAAVSAASCCA